jgi:hypothetical protein
MIAARRVAMPFGERMARTSAASGILGAALLAAPQPGEELIDVAPKPRERGALFFRQLGQVLLVANAGEVGVSLPALELFVRSGTR